MTPVLPGVNSLIKGKKIFEASLREMFRDPFFVPGCGVSRVPERSNGDVAPPQMAEFWTCCDWPRHRVLGRASPRHFEVDVLQVLGFN